MYCSKCGQLIENGQPFCPNCGASVSNPNTLPSPQVQNNGKSAALSKKALTVIIVVGLALIGMLYTVIFPDEFNKCSSADAVVDACADALTKANAEMLLRLCFTKEGYEKLKPETIQTYQSSMEMSNALVKGLTNSEARYEMSISIKLKLDSDELREIQSYYKYNYDVDIPITEGYTADVKMKINGSRDTVNLILFHTKSEGWKITADSIRNLIGFGVG